MAWLPPCNVSAWEVEQADEEFQDSLDYRIEFQDNLCYTVRPCLRTHTTDRKIKAGFWSGVEEEHKIALGR